MEVFRVNNPAFSICVYCGSRPGIDPSYTAAAEQVGHWIGSHGGQLVYGGGKGGLMGVVAEAALTSGARVVGIIPQSMVEREWANHDCTELHVVDNMHQRKHLMAHHSDAFLALPGGLGTLEELFEVWTWRQLDFHSKPLGLLNTNSYYQGLIDFIEHSVQQQFVSAGQSGLLEKDSDPEQLLSRLVASINGTNTDRLDQI